MTPSFSLIVVEGALEVPVSLKILRVLGIPTEGLQPIDKRGRTNFWPAVTRYNEAAKTGLVLGLADLETDPCPSGLIERNLPRGRRPGFLLRIAEPMLESWLLGDTAAIASFLKVSPKLIPRNPESEVNPKLTIVNLARRSASRDIREELVPDDGSHGTVGRGYRARLTVFVEDQWNPFEARQRCQSLDRALKAIAKATGVTTG